MTPEEQQLMQAIAGAGSAPGDPMGMPPADAGMPMGAPPMADPMMGGDPMMGAPMQPDPMMGGMGADPMMGAAPMGGDPMGGMGGMGGGMFPTADPEFMSQLLAQILAAQQQDQQMLMAAQQAALLSNPVFAGMIGEAPMPGAGASGVDAMGGMPAVPPAGPDEMQPPLMG